MGEYDRMKTTVDIPDALFRQAKSAAAERGVSLHLLISEALSEKLRAQESEDKPWMKSFGQLRHLHKETVRINKIIEQEFRQIDPEDWK